MNFHKYLFGYHGYPESSHRLKIDESVLNRSHLGQFISTADSFCCISVVVTLIRQNSLGNSSLALANAVGMRANNT